MTLYSVYYECDGDDLVFHYVFCNDDDQDDQDNDDDSNDVQLNTGVRDHNTFDRKTFLVFISYRRSHSNINSSFLV